ncbi:NAD+ synthase [Spongorhabdus nitratireducens]
MSSDLRIAMAQLNMVVGDIEGNTDKVIAAANKARDELSADIIVYPELTLCGYPPEDLLLRDSMLLRIDRALEKLKAVSGIHLVIGAPGAGEGGLENLALVMRDGEIIQRYAKQHLPNYQVFDEKRYFVPGTESALFEYKGVKIGLSVCEDIWYADPAAQLKAKGAELILNLNASPFHREKLKMRQQVVAERCQESGLPVVYVNQIGGQDELVFDGGSFAMNTDGSLAAVSKWFEEDLSVVSFNTETHQIEAAAMNPAPEELERVYNALVLGVRDYVNKNGFKGIVLGLSGGIDSGLVLAIAVDALGKDRVEAVMMPYRYTSDMSKEDAAEQAEMLGVEYKSLAIEPMFDAFMSTLSAEFANTSRDTTEENLQSRCRGVLLMAISNKKGRLVLTTGNKSEMAVGYATLYGDMAGGFDVLKDVPKTLVFKLAEYRNTISPAVPQRVIDRPPSAELAPDQVDEDSLPPYEVLDRILELYIEEDRSAEYIVAEGFDREEVYRVIRLVDINEYKRRQAPVGVRITPRGFGRDRRYPITNGWKPGE